MEDQNNQPDNKNTEKQIETTKKEWIAPDFKEASISSETMGGGSVSLDGGSGYS